MCKNWEEKGTCEFEDMCNFAHGDDDLRPIDPKQPVGTQNVTYNLFSYYIISWYKLCDIQ